MSIMMRSDKWTGGKMNFVKVVLLTLWLLPLSLTAAPTANAIADWLNDPRAPLAGIEVKAKATYWQAIDTDPDGFGGAANYAPERSQCVIFAPHQFFDEHTLTLAQSLFPLCQLLLWNTQHRHTRTKQGDSRDFSLTTQSWPYQLLKAYLTRYPSATIIQLHGFSRDKRHTEAAKNADLILSNGNRSGSKRLQDLQQCFSNAGYQALRYPQQVSELGGTRNVLNQLLTQPGQFIHLEMERNTRLGLVQSETKLEQWKLCFAFLHSS
ncbi:hypothetical protein ACFOEE_12690 [Pseudoalteromonas fenneropenaei]|uniref:Uncharacterized protein n=1 Tax=Pseudoalteromonas fenneropenaei TaxID=1737459 RepID=A0ABV7CL75_9GAMM